MSHPPMYNGRQNLDEWIRQVESRAALNDLDDAATVRYARTLLSPEIRRLHDGLAHPPTDIGRMAEFLQEYLEGNDQIRLGALDQLKDKQYNMSTDPKDFRRECTRLFDVARVAEVAERLRYLNDMLPDRLYAVMIAANPQNTDAFYNVLERYWR
jgi:hypothetical protein